MKNTIKMLALLSASVMIFMTSCNTEDNLLEDRKSTLPQPVTPSPGDMDLSVYVSIGNSLTAGFMDFALYDRGQGYSVGNILAGQFALAGGGIYNQPDINSENGYNSQLSDPANGIILGRTILDTDIPGPVPIGPGELIGEYTGDKSMINNWAIPGARVVDVLSPAYSANPYYNRIASSPGTSTVLGDALSRRPTFVSVWLGGNDVLGWALSGGTAPDGEVTPGAEATSTATLTSTAVFGNAYGAVLSSLFGSNDTKGVVVTIPPVLTVPFFQLVGHDIIPMDAATAGVVNSAFTGHNAIITQMAATGVITENEAALRNISFEAGSNNRILIVDKNLVDLGPTWNLLVTLGALTETERAQLEPYRQARQATASDLMLLSSASVIGTLAIPNNPASIIGVAIPLGDQFVLTPTEQQTIIARTTAFNTTIATLAANYSDRVVVYDVNPIILDAVGLSDGVYGLNYEGYYYTPDFGPNGIYSTDGIHPNPRGNAIIANEITDLLNSSFNATIPLTDVGFYPSVQLAQ